MHPYILFNYNFGPLFKDIKSLMPNTPYTRKESLPSKEGIFDPVSNATNNVKKLREISAITELSEFIR